MDKNEILQRAQTKRYDEGAQFFHQKAKAIAGAVFTASAIILMICSAMHGRRITEILMLYWIYLGSTCFLEYYYTRRKTELAVGIFSLVWLIGVSATYVRSVFL